MKRIIKAPTGTELTCKNWLIEAAYRMIQNNLDPEVAFDPDNLIVYGGRGKAARDWKSFDAILNALRNLDEDETLLVQSGKPVGVFRSHTDAPRVLIANTNIVPHWATQEQFDQYERDGLMMYGQMTAGSWIYIGTQGILQGTYETFGSLARQHEESEMKPTLMRLIDLLKKKGMTALFTSLTTGKGESVIETSEVGVSSLMDTWLLLRNVEYNGERNRTIFVLKSRGMGHSNQVREFVMTDHGIDLVDVYLGSDRVLTGTARVAQEEKEKAAAELQKKNHERRLRDLSHKKTAIDAQIAILRATASAEEEEVRFINAQEDLEAETLVKNTERMRTIRGGANKAATDAGRKK